MDLSQSSEASELFQRPKMSRSRRKKDTKSPPSSQSDWSFSSQSGQPPKIKGRSIVIAGSSLGIVKEHKRVTTIKTVKTKKAIKRVKPSSASKTVKTIKPASASTPQTARNSFPPLQFSVLKKRPRSSTAQGWTESLDRDHQTHSKTKMKRAKESHTNINTSTRKRAATHTTKSSNRAATHTTKTSNRAATHATTTDDVSESEEEAPYSQSFISERTTSKDLRKQLLALEDCVPDKQKPSEKREPIRPGDIIAYYHPLFKHGEKKGFRVTQVLGTTSTPQNGSRLDLDNGDFLPEDTTITRVGEYMNGSVIRHMGLAREIKSFRIVTRRLPNTPSGFEKRVDAFCKFILHSQEEWDRLPDKVEKDTPEEQPCTHSVGSIHGRRSQGLDSAAARTAPINSPQVSQPEILSLDDSISEYSFEGTKKVQVPLSSLLQERKKLSQKRPSAQENTNSERTCRASPTQNETSTSGSTLSLTRLLDVANNPPRKGTKAKPPPKKLPSANPLEDSDDDELLEAPVFNRAACPQNPKSTGATPNIASVKLDNGINSRTIQDWGPSRSNRTGKSRKDRHGNRNSHSSASLTFLALFLLLGAAVSFVPPQTCLGGAFRPNRNTVTTATFQEESIASPKEQDVWDKLLARFQGDFDNYNQVVEDRREGLTPREGGGHEHIHCCLVPLEAETRLAAFYFDGDPTAIFRFRFYKLVPNSSTNSVDTVLYTLDPDLERALRQCSDPLDWKKLFDDQNGSERVTELKGCDVRWSWTLDPVQHSYASSHEKDHDGIHAIMINGEALVESQQMPGVKILIRDQLSLYNDEIYIHDRGFDPETMRFIYGNQRDIPYQLERVTTMATDRTRKVVNDDLKWTLGPTFRTPKEYEAKLANVGGPSRPRK